MRIRPLIRQYSTYISGFLATFVLFASGSVANAQAKKVTVVEKPVTVKVDEGSWEDVLKYVKTQKGKVVVVDLWSTSCLPCMREFKHLVELSKKYPKNVACVSVSTDYYGVASKPPKFYRPRVEKFLKKQKAGFKNFLCSTSSDDLFEKIELGSIPAIYVFGPDGKVVKRFDNDDIEDEEDVFSYKKHINPVVGKLVDGVKKQKASSEESARRPKKKS